jgi:hypothetical protein
MKWRKKGWCDFSWRVLTKWNAKERPSRYARKARKWAL